MTGRQRVIAAVALVCLVAVVLTARWWYFTVHEQLPEAAVIHPAWAGCEAADAFDTGNPPPSGSIPDGFVPTTAIWCLTGAAPRSRSKTQQRLEERSTNLGSLVTYLRRPSLVSHDPTTACPASLIVGPWLALTDATGRWIVPKLPTGVCGQPLANADGSYPGPTPPVTVTVIGPAR